MPSRSRRPDPRRGLSVRIEFDSTPDARQYRGLLSTVARTVLKQSGVTGRVALALHLVDDEAIRDLNRRFRGIDAATDVLSFPLQDGRAFVLPEAEAQHLGDIVISLPRTEAQAEEFGHSFERELGYLTAHGILHALGHDHETEPERLAMREREETAMQAVGLNQ